MSRQEVLAAGKPFDFGRKKHSMQKVVQVCGRTPSTTM